MAESGENYEPDPNWKGWDYQAARAKHVDPTAGRGYALKSALNKLPDKEQDIKAIAKSKNGGVIVPDKISTDAKSPVVIITDGTGSMGAFPNTIFKKLPLLDDGIKDYLEDYAVSLMMIGDAGSDKLPLQVQEFASGKDLVDKLNNLEIEGGGGGNQVESYELAALYAARNIEIPKATKPVLIFICDEGLYANVDIKWAKTYAKVTLEDKMSTSELFDELKKKFSVYCVRKHCDSYGIALDGDKMIGANKLIHERWAKLVGEDKIAVLLDASRVVDVILGLLAHETGKVDFFEKEINDRQKPEQVATVMKAMTSLKKPNSVVTGKDQGKTIIDPNLSVTNKSKKSAKQTDSLL